MSRTQGSGMPLYILRRANGTQMPFNITSRPLADIRLSCICFAQSGLIGKKALLPTIKLCLVGKDKDAKPREASVTWYNELLSTTNVVHGLRGYSFQITIIFDGEPLTMDFFIPRAELEECIR